MADYYHGGGTMYSNTDECYNAGRHGSRRVYSHTDGYYDDDRRPAYTDECYDGGRHGAKAVYSNEYSRGTAGYGGDQEYYKREEREHKHRERMGEVGVLASGAFALYEGQQAKKDPAHAQRHRIEQGVAAATALGAGGYAYHEHHEQKEASYDAKEHRRPHNHYSN